MSVAVAKSSAGDRATLDGPARTSTHVPGLDGLRGLAVAAVVVYHLGVGWAKGGYLGVDTFLVLSGYLITSGLLREHRRTGRVSLGAFWTRRARRLLPAVVVLIAAIGVYTATTALPDQARSLRLDAVSALGFVSNWRFVVTAQGYFGQTAAPSLLRHTWSLGVEAQLYLVWPLIMLAVLSRRGHRALVRVALALAAASAIAGVILAHGGAQVNRAYYGTDTRAAAFLVGAAVAGALAGRRGRDAAGRAGLGIGLAGLAVTAWMWVTLSGTSPWLFRGGLPLAAAASAAVIVDVVGRPLGGASRALSFAPLRGLGRVSYGVYLWHWPLFLVLDQQTTGVSGLALIAVRLGATAAATAASWVLIERPILSRRFSPRRLGGRPAIAIVVALALVAGLVLAPVARDSSGTASRAPVASAPPHFVPVGLSMAPKPLDVRTGTVPALVFGDSVGFTLAYGMLPIASRYGVDLGDAALIGCGVALGSALRVAGGAGPVPTPCDAWATDWQRWVQVAHPAVSVILLGRWEVLDRRIDGQWQHLGQPGFDEYLSAQLDLAIAIAGSDGATVIVCTAPYYQGAERPQGGVYAEDTPARVNRFNQVVRAAVDRHPGVILFDLHSLVSPGGRYTATINGRAIRSSDGVHFTPDGSAFVAAKLLPLVDRLGGRRGTPVTTATGKAPK